MSSPSRNFPPFAPDNKYQHKIDANAAWVKSKPSPDRRPPPAVEKLTPWGTAYPLFHKNDPVLVQFNPAGTWFQGKIYQVLLSKELRGMSEDEVRLLPADQLAKMKCLYDVLLPPDVVKCDIEEKAILPRHFEHRLLLNSPCFKVGERVMVQVSEGPKAQTHIGKITSVGVDRVTRDKDSWHVVPRLYTVYLECLDIEGCWTKESIIRMDPTPPGLGPPPGLTLPTPSYKRP